MQNAMNGAVQSLVAFIDRGHQDVGVGVILDLAKPAAEFAHQRLIGQHGVSDKAGETNIVAADRHKQQIDLAGIFLFAAIKDQPADKLFDNAADMIGFGVVLGRRIVRTALSRSER